MDHMIKMLCSDIDGTLLNKERWLSERTTSAFTKAQLPTILASSRPPQAMRYLQKGLGIDGSPLIAFNGGLIIGTDGKQIESNTFSRDILQAVIQHHKSHTYNLSIYSYEHWLTELEDTHTKHERFTTRDTPQLQSPMKSLEFLTRKKLGIHKLMCMGESESLDSLITFLTPLYSDKVHLYRSKETYLEITPKYIDKAKALKKILETYYDFGMESVMAFGDNHNDDELIRTVGYGVAVGNATPTLKSIAKYTSEYTNKEDAVARAIETFII